MDTTGMVSVTRHLNELCALYRVRPLADAQVRIWFERLKAHAAEDICDILIRWPDDNDRPPTIDKVLAVARVRAAGFHRDRYQAAAFDPNALRAATASAARELAQIHAILNSPRPHPTAWARRLLPYHGTYATKLAREALARAPGAHGLVEDESEREARLEREAIRTEGAAMT